MRSVGGRDGAAIRECALARAAEKMHQLATNQTPTHDRNLSEMNYYNGYSPEERERKLRASHRLWPAWRGHPCSRPPCHLCGDPQAIVQPHSEDYSEPYEWEPPFTYALCRPCHSRIHKRFSDPPSWLAYKLHLRRGGYGSDLKSPKT